MEEKENEENVVGEVLLVYLVRNGNSLYIKRKYQLNGIKWFIGKIVQNGSRSYYDGACIIEPVDDNKGEV